MERRFFYLERKGKSHALQTQLKKIRRINYYGNYAKEGTNF